MVISTNYPPNYQDFKQYFPDLEKHTPRFCYGNIIYNPFKTEITPDVEVHEQAHSRQQGNYPEIWYNKYFTDRNFRLNEELEAYGTQYLFVKQHMKGKLLEWGLDKMAEALSSDLYGNLCDYGEAKSWIRHFVVV